MNLRRVGSGLKFAVEAGLDLVEARWPARIIVRSRHGIVDKGQKLGNT